MTRLAIALVAVALTAGPGLAQVRTQPTLPSDSPTLQSPSPGGTPSPSLTPQPFGGAAPRDPVTGLPSTLPPSTSGSRSSATGSPSASPSPTSPSLGAPSPTTLPPPVWSAPSPPAGQPLAPGSR